MTRSQLTLTHNHTTHPSTPLCPTLPGFQSPFHACTAPVTMTETRTMIVQGAADVEDNFKAKCTLTQLSTAVFTNDTNG